MESKTETKTENSKIVIEKMRFKVVDKYPKNFTENDKKEIEHSLYQIFKNYV